MIRKLHSFIFIFALFQICGSSTADRKKTRYAVDRKVSSRGIRPHPQRMPHLAEGGAGPPKSRAASPILENPIPDQDTVKPIALVFPGYHALPLYEKVWGLPNFNEWQLLRQTPRVGVGGALTRYPHEDIGYYDFLDVDYRRHMGRAASRFGIYGFCFHHEWIRGQPLFGEAMSRLIEDDEPDLPFFLVWSNDNLVLNVDGTSWKMEPQYHSTRDHAAHFAYLLKLFEHRNYMLYDEMPILAVSQSSPQYSHHRQNTLELWQELAIELGMKGICIIHVHSPDAGGAAIVDASSRGDMLLEPAASARPLMHTAPKSVLGTVTFSKLQAWGAISSRLLPSLPPLLSQITVTGTYWHFNDNPQHGRMSRNNCSTIPKIHVPDSAAGFELHLKLLASLIPKGKTPPNLLMLNSWNGWSEQTMFEPNDIEGYDVLMAVKRTFLPRSNRSILHLGTNGSPSRYISDLMSLFWEFEHHIGLSDAVEEEKLALIHVHCSVETVKSGIVNIIADMHKFKEKNIKIFVSVHDYGWIYPDMEAIPLKVLKTAKPENAAIKNILSVFDLSDEIIFPTIEVKSHYFSIGKLKSLEYKDSKCHVATPPDMMAAFDAVKVPKISSTFSVGFVGGTNSISGFDIFNSLLKKYGSIRSRSKKFQLTCQTLWYNANDAPSFNDRTGQILNSTSEVHLLFYLSSRSDPYPYEVTTIINSGLPVIYLQQGAMNDRLSKVEERQKSSRFFPVTDVSKIYDQFVKAVRYAIQNNGILREPTPISKNVQPSRWYIENYPPRNGSGKRHLNLG